MTREGKGSFIYQLIILHSNVSPLSLLLLLLLQEGSRSRGPESIEREKSTIGKKAKRNSVDFKI